MFDFCKTISGIQFLLIDQKNVLECEESQRARFETAKTVKGTQQYHHFVPMSLTSMKVYKLSSQQSPPERTHITNDPEEADMADEIRISTDEIREQNFICCLYDDFPWIGLMKILKSMETIKYNLCILMALPSNSVGQYHQIHAGYL